MPTISEALAIAFDHLRAGRMELAETIASRVLDADPNHAEALHLAGLIALQRGVPDKAVELLGRAAAIAPDNADCLHNLGVAWASSGRMVDAVAAFRRVIDLADDYPGVHTNLGNALAELGRTDEALVSWPGETFASRHSRSHLAAIGLTETIVHSEQEYVDRAVELAHDLPRLTLIRGRLRTQMAGSPLCDGQRLAENLLSLLRGVWQDWCRTR
jgi:predicted O-linked N-acetylglucosamine transferase (SPINDLY family)